MKKIIKLTEADLTRIVRRVIKEQDELDLGFEENELINKPGYTAQKMITGLPIKVTNKTKNETQNVTLKFSKKKIDSTQSNEFQDDGYLFWGTNENNGVIKNVSLYDQLTLEFTLPFKVLELKEFYFNEDEKQVSKIELTPSGDKTDVKVDMQYKKLLRRLHLDGYVDEKSQRPYISPQDNWRRRESVKPSQENRKEYLTAIFNADKIRLGIHPLFEPAKEDLNVKLEESFRRRRNYRRY